MLPVLNIGSLAIRTPALGLLAGLWFGLEVAERAARKRGIDGDKMFNIGFYTLLAGVLGARLGFVVTHLGLYADIRPITRLLTSIFALAPGTESPLIGLVAALAVAYFLLRRWNIDQLDAGDAFAPGLAVMIVGIGIANLLSGDYYGIPTRLPWGINLWGATRHPTQIYLVLVAAGTWYMLYRLDAGKRKKDRPKQGILVQVFALIMGVAVLLLEPLRADSPVILAGVRSVQVAALLGILGALAGFAIRAPVEDPEAV